MGDVSTEPSTTALPSAPPIEISPHLTIQPPLSRRGQGPGLILVCDHYAQLEKSDKTLDPPPLLKWAEEGYAVAQILVPGKPDEFPLKQAIDELRKLKECDSQNGFGLISYLSRIPFYVEEPTCISSDIKAVISYGGKKLSTINPGSKHVPQLLHIAGHPSPRRESISVVPEPELSSSTTSLPSQENIKSFRYLDAKTDSGWVFPADPAYHASSANLAHTRSLTFLKPLLQGPFFDLEAIWEEHTKFEFAERDVEKTMATMVQEPYVNHIPTMTGGIGRERLTAFYTHHFIFANPDDTALELVSRTVGIDRIIDEFVFKCTHDRTIDWLLPSIPPTHKPLSVPFTSVVCVRGDRLYHEHISWDQATALVQIGLLPEYLKFPYPIDSKEAPAGKRYEVKTPSGGKELSDKLVEESSRESNGMIGVGWRVVDDA